MVVLLAVIHTVWPFCGNMFSKCVHAFGARTKLRVLRAVLGKFMGCIWTSMRQNADCAGVAMASYYGRAMVDGSRQDIRKTDFRDL